MQRIARPALVELCLTALSVSLATISTLPRMPAQPLALMDTIPISQHALVLHATRLALLARERAHQAALLAVPSTTAQESIPVQRATLSAMAALERITQSALPAQQLSSWSSTPILASQLAQTTLPISTQMAQCASSAMQPAPLAKALSPSTVRAALLSIRSNWSVPSKIPSTASNNVKQEPTQMAHSVEVFTLLTLGCASNC